MSSVWEVIKATGRVLEIPFHDFQDDDELVIKGDELNEEDWSEINKLEKRFGLVLLNGQKKIMIGDLGENAGRKITSLTAPELLEIDEWALGYFENLKDVSAPKVQFIGKDAFHHCISIEYIKLPASLKEICGNPFKGCEALQTIDVEPGNPIYESIDGVLYTRGPTELKKLAAYPGGRAGKFASDIAEEIDWYVFHGCRGLTGVFLPNLRRVSDERSNEITLGWHGLNKRIDLPGEKWCFRNPFVGCDSLEWIEVAPSNPVFESSEGVLYTKGQEGIVAYPSAKTGDCFTNASVLYVGEAAFSGSRLTSVSLPNARVVGDEAFELCHKLVRVSLPNASFFVRPLN
jgi:hypothetical protein